MAGALLGSVIVGPATLSTPAAAQFDHEGLACLAPPYDSPQTVDQTRIAHLVQWMQSRLAPYPPLTELIQVDAPEICLAERMFGAQAYYEPEMHRIVFSETLAPDLMNAIAIHELRHAHQAKLGACPNPDLSMEATGHVTLAMEADASAVSLAIAWELRAAGEPETWDALSNWPSHIALAQAFEEEMLESNDVSRATSAAFSAWYANERLRDAYYLAACSAYLDRQDATHALPSYGSIEPDFLETLCTLPDGRTYPCDMPP